MQSSIPLTVLEECQSTAYQVLEDMHRLYNHHIVQHSQQRQIEYLQLVNRKNPKEGAEPSAINGNDPIHTRFLITDRVGLEKMRQEAVGLLHDYDASRLLPPPLWLRMLPVCFSIILDGELFSESEHPIFRWLAFNVDVPGKDKSSALSLGTVNINSNRTKPVIELFQPAENLSLVLYEYLRSPNKPQTLPYYTSWGIRFRTIGNNDNLGHWIDIQADIDNIKANVDQIPQFVAAKITAPRPPFPQSPSSVAFIRDIIHQWTGQTGNQDSDHRPTPTRELSAYCQTLQQFYPQGRWPSEGIDCLLCPSIVWSPEPNVLGAAGTIYWGFEGSLTQWQCGALLLLSQILMASTPLYINNPQIKESAVLRGKTDFLHKVTSHVGALIQVIEDLEDKLNTIKDQSEDSTNNPSLNWTEQAYVSGVSTMFLVAETEREYHPQPKIALQKLARPWDQDIVEWFSRVLVWPFVRHRIVADARILAKLDEANVVLDGVYAADQAIPEISVEGTFSVQRSEEVYLFFWYALNAAMQHSAVNQLVHNEKAKITIRRVDNAGKTCIRVENTGEPPNVHSGQPGWIRDLNMLRDFTETFSWTILCVDGQHSVYDHDQRVWVTQIQRTNTEDRN